MAAKKKAKRPGQKVVVREPDGTQHECTRGKGGSLSCSAPRAGKKAAKKKPVARSGSSGSGVSHQLWVYHKEWTDEMHKALGARSGYEVEGGGCCTEGFSDTSLSFKTRKSAESAAKKLVALPGVGWVHLFDYDADVNEIEGTEKKLFSRSLPAAIRNKIEKGKRRNKSRRGKLD